MRAFLLYWRARTYTYISHRLRDWRWMEWFLFSNIPTYISGTWKVGHRARTAPIRGMFGRDTFFFYLYAYRLVRAGGDVFEFASTYCICIPCVLIYICGTPGQVHTHHVFAKLKYQFVRCSRKAKPSSESLISSTGEGREVEGLMIEGKTICDLRFWLSFHPHRTFQMIDKNRWNDTKPTIDKSDCVCLCIFLSSKIISFPIFGIEQHASY